MDAALGFVITPTATNLPPPERNLRIDLVLKHFDEVLSLMDLHDQGLALA